MNQPTDIMSRIDFDVPSQRRWSRLCAALSTPFTVCQDASRSKSVRASLVAIFGPIALLLTTVASGAAQAIPATGVRSIISSEPLVPGTHELVRERVIRPTQGSPGELGNTIDLALGDNGTVVVVEQAPAALFIFDSAGKYQRHIGRDGDGPGEFRMGFVALRGGILALQDPRNARVTAWAVPSGQLMRSVRSSSGYWDKIHLTHGGDVFVMLAPPMTGDGDAQAPIRFVRIRLGTGSSDTLSLIPGRRESPISKWSFVAPNGMKMQVTPPLSPKFHHTIGPAGESVSGWSDSYQLLQSDPNGNSAIRFGRALSPETVTHDERESLRDDVLQRTLRSGMPITERDLRRAFDLDRVPSTRPFFDWISIDGQGRTWVKRSSTDTIHVHFDLFTRDGRWLATARLKAPKWAQGRRPVYAISSDAIALLEEDDDGFPEIVIYRFPSLARR